MVRIDKTKYLKDQITGIYKEIKDNGGKITKSQQERIDQLYDQMKTRTAADEEDSGVCGGRRLLHRKNEIVSISGESSIQPEMN